MINAHACLYLGWSHVVHGEGVNRVSTIHTFCSTSHLLILNRKKQFEANIAAGEAEIRTIEEKLKNLRRGLHELCADGVAATRVANKKARGTEEKKTSD